MTDTSRSRASKHSRSSLLKGFGTVAAMAVASRSKVARAACLGTASITQTAPWDRRLLLRDTNRFRYLSDRW